MQTQKPRTQGDRVQLQQVIASRAARPNHPRQDRFNDFPVSDVAADMTPHPVVEGGYGSVEQAASVGNHYLGLWGA